MKMIQQRGSYAQHRTKFAILTTLVLALSGQGIAHAEGPLDLLDRKHRPTVADLLSVINPLEATNPFAPRQADILPDHVVEAGSQIIADIEKAFPGHRWAPLGRDTSVVSDILESYTILHQQKERVVRINASGQSFTSSNQYLGLLQTAGLLTPTGAPIVPFILLDPTSWNTTGQIRNLTEAVFRANPNLSPYTVNAVALGGSGSSTSLLIPVSNNLPDLHQYTRGHAGAPYYILSTSGQFSYLGNDVHGVEMAWHDKFGSLNYVAGQGWIAEPGRPMSRETRSHILWRMFEIYKRVASPEFQTRLQLRANEYGIQLPGFSIAPPFSTEAPVDSDALIAWMIDWRRYTSDPRYVFHKATIEPQITRGLTQIAAMNLSDTELGSLVATLSDAERKVLTLEQLQRSKQTTRSLELLNSAVENQRAELARLHSPLFVQLRPSLKEANQYIELLGRESDGHISLVTQLLPLMGAADSLLSSSDYAHLIRPKLNRTREYNAARKQYLAKQPGLMSRIKAWGSKPRPTKLSISTEVKK